MTLFMVVKSVGRVTKTVTSSAYATTVTLCSRFPIVIPDSLSSSVRRKGWRHSVSITIIKGQACRKALRIGMGPAMVPLICTEAVVFS